MRMKPYGHQRHDNCVYWCKNDGCCKKYVKGYGKNACRVAKKKARQAGKRALRSCAF